MLFFFFFNDTATTEIYTLSLHDALPICHPEVSGCHGPAQTSRPFRRSQASARVRADQEMEEGKDGKGRRGSAWQDRDRNQDRGPWGTPLRVGGAVPVQAGSPVCCSAICARNYQRRKCLRPAFVGKAGLFIGGCGIYLRIEDGRHKPRSARPPRPGPESKKPPARSGRLAGDGLRESSVHFQADGFHQFAKALALGGVVVDERSEERRVGKECRSRWSPYH